MRRSSAFSTSAACELEVLLVDDGSTDGTADIVTGFDDPRLRAIRTRNRGKGAAVRTAIAAATGETR